MQQFTNVAPQIGFGEAIKICFNKYVDFKGRARRSEYWWWQLFQVLVCLVTCWIPIIGQIVPLVFVLPNLSAATRRLHDVGKSGWWLLAAYIPLIIAVILMCTAIFEYKEDPAFVSSPSFIAGIIIYFIGLILGIVLFVWTLLDSKPEENQYGPSPKYIVTDGDQIQK